jgi:4-hydroxy-tetrahydrodipicolinate reductase
MKTILQIGFGPLGVQTGKYIAQKETIKTAAVVDIDESLKGKSLREISNELPKKIFIFNSVESALNNLEIKPDVAIITTVSSLEKLIPQVEEVAKFGIPVISTCEELAYPWELQPELSKKLDSLCKTHNIACLGTGINPGFLMDYLPSVLSSVCKNIEQITVERIQDATPRRIPFQKKIGAGLNLQQFKAKELEGTLRHVGLQESIYLLANSMGVSLDTVTEDLQPVISSKDISTKDIQIKTGDARGVEQIGYGYENGICKVKMHFKAAIGEPRSYDKVTIKGTPSFTSEIDGGVNGDIATCAIAINSINSILKAPAGLHTMSDIGVPGYIN